MRAVGAEPPPTKEQALVAKRHAASVGLTKPGD